MPLPRPVSFCPICGIEIIGRSDKIFCSVKCKSEYHTRRKKQVIPFAKEIDAKLHRNWIILQEIYEKSQSRKIFVSKSELHKEGFNFNYHTSSQINKDGKTYHYIYNFGMDGFFRERSHGASFDKAQVAESRLCFVQVGEGYAINWIKISPPLKTVGA